MSMNSLSERVVGVDVSTRGDRTFEAFNERQHDKIEEY